METDSKHLLSIELMIISFIKKKLFLLWMLPYQWKCASDSRLKKLKIIIIDNKLNLIIDTFNRS